MKIQIRDFRRIERADLTANPICLIAGHNGAGKTSTYQAIQAALLQAPLTLPGVLMKTADAMVRTGAKVGTVKAMDGDSTITIAYPSCNIEIEGAAPPMASEVAAGRLSILDLSEKERAAALVDVLKCQPSRAELAEVMTDIGYTGKAVDAVWAEIEEKGWDVAHAKSREAGTKLKGSWETVTAEKWGDKKADGWLPQGWTDDLNDAKLEDLQMDAVDAQSALEREIQNGAVDASRIDELRLQSDAARGADVAGRQSAADTIREELQELKDQRAALPPADDVKGVPCPSCGTHLVYDKPYGAADGVLKVAEDVSDKELKQRRMLRAELDGKIGKRAVDLQAAEAALRNAETLAQSGRDADAKLAELDTTGTGEERVAKARETVAAANARLRMFEAKAKATATFASWKRNVGLIDALASTGVRQKVMVRKLTDLNERLAKVCADARWGVVRIDENLAAWMNTEPYWLLSESMQFRCRVTLQVAIAALDGSSAILIDRADMLDQNGRNALFLMLKKSGLRAFVCMTTSAREKTPNLAAAKYGTSVWLEAGVGASMEAVPA